MFFRPVCAYQKEKGLRSEIRVRAGVDALNV